MRHRRRFERPALWVLLVTLGHIGMSLWQTSFLVHAQLSSQDYINGAVEMRLRALEGQIALVSQRLDYILLAVAGGFIAQVFQLLAASRARGRGRGREHNEREEETS